LARKAIARLVRRQVRDRAQDRCEYCQHPASHSSAPFVCDHILPRVRGTGDTPDELAWACPACNGHKYARTHALDPQTGRNVPLLNPRRQQWSKHFVWSDDFMVIIGRTATGRATVEALRLNRPELINLRRALLALGLHPPERAQETLILAFVNAHGRIVRREVGELSRLSDDEASGLLRRLVAENKLKRRGKGRGTSYESAD